MRLRSANRDNACNTWNVNSSGNVNNNNANWANRFSPIVQIQAIKATHSAAGPDIGPQGTEFPGKSPNNAEAMQEDVRACSCWYVRILLLTQKEEIIDFDSLYESMWKCRKGVSWKPGVKHYTLNGITETVKLCRELESGTYQNGKPKTIQILYPKKREGLSIPFRDRVYQRSINDNVLYPEMTRHFILDNCACQRGKGPDFARKRLKKHLWNFYCNYGLDGYVIQTDIHGYYPNMRHGEVRKCFERYLDPEVFQMVMKVLDSQYAGDTGYNPGSQMVQIAGISLLDRLDHHIKERLHVKHYIKYMDDLLILEHSYERSEEILKVITDCLSELGFEVNEKKTHIRPISEGFEFLGFNYKLTETGKIVMTITGQNVHHEQKKTVHMIRSGATKEKCDECSHAWEAHADHGNTYHVKRRMRVYREKKWKEAEDAKVQRETNGATGGEGVCQPSGRTDRPERKNRHSGADDRHRISAGRRAGNGRNDG